MPEKPPVRFSEKFFKPREYSKTGEYGRSVHMVISIERHGDPFKDPETGLSLNALTPEGVQKEREKGKSIASSFPKGGIKAYTSPQRRAEQSIGEQLAGVEDAGRGAQIINKRFSQVRKNVEKVYPNKFKVDPVKLAEEMKKIKAENPGISDDQLKVREGELAETMKAKVTPIIIREKDDLNALVEAGFKPLLAQMTPEEKQDIKKRNNRLVQMYFEHTGDLGDTLPYRGAAALLAYRIATEMGMMTRLKNSSDVILKNLTHGPIPDSFLRELLGHKNVADVGGAVNTMEGFDLDVRTDTNGEIVAKLLFRGKTTELTKDQLAKIKELAQEGKELLAGLKKKEKSPGVLWKQIVEAKK